MIQLAGERPLLKYGVLTAIANIMAAHALGLRVSSEFNLILEHLRAVNDLDT